MRDIEEIEHMLFHALTEDAIGAKLEQAKSQQEVYEIFQTIPYFDLTMEEFQAGIQSIRESEPEDYEHDPHDHADHEENEED